MSLAATWLSECLYADLNRLASAIDIAYMVKPPVLLERIARASEAAERWELAHAAFSALGGRLPEGAADCYERAVRALVAARALDRARRFARTRLRTLRREPARLRPSEASMQNGSDVTRMDSQVPVELGTRVHSRHCFHSCAETHTLPNSP